MIRECREEDLPVIMDIANRAWQGIYDMYLGTLGEELFKLQVRDRHAAKGEQVRDHWTRHPDWLLVCEEHGRVVGFTTFYLDPEKSIGEIGNNAVDPECGLKGIGQQMYAAVLERLRQEGMQYAKVLTGLDPAHAPARRAYERAGFDLKTEDVTYYKRLQDACR